MIKNNVLIKITAHFLGALIVCVAVQADAIEFGMPIKCNYGKDCFIQNYFDEDSSPDYKDYHCGKLSYNEHNGTDFRVRDYVAMNNGVDVIAAADGTVFNLRESVADMNVRKGDIKEISKYGCGNTVVLAHEGGIKTLYCHMKRGSIVVKKGDKVIKGQKLGEVGLSGLTEFPHVHLGVVTKDGKILDPFTGGSSMVGCDAPQKSLWDKETREKLIYIPTGLLSSSFSDELPEAEAARGGKFRVSTVSDNVPLLVLWFDVFGLQPKDALIANIFTPEGKLLVHKTFDIPHHGAVFFNYIGIKKREAPWPKGQYLGTIQLLRGDQQIIDERRTLLVE